MRIAVSSTGKTLNGEVTLVFGRCPYFIIADVEGSEIKGFKAIENTSAKQMSGAGIAAARIIAEQKAGTVITGNIGPRASTVFKQFKISAYSAKGKVKDAIKLYLDKKLEKIC
ncbi:MAG: NifB/NifX family molybdenum-iron cluster-binding protein [Nanoarchaeota archaeon]|nr:NifB/NifX family molybdenum-iron cluster-binding protein [Nanoarchaeota archaeon]